MNAPEKTAPGESRAEGRTGVNSVAGATTAIVQGADGAAQVAADKRFATAQARAALAGVALHRLDDGRLLAARGGLTRDFPDLGAVEQWLLRV